MAGCCCVSGDREGSSCELRDAPKTIACAQSAVDPGGRRPTEGGCWEIGAEAVGDSAIAVEARDKSTMGTTQLCPQMAENRERLEPRAAEGLDLQIPLIAT